MKKHFVIYIPGLGDKRLYAGGQQAALALWRTSHVQAYYFVVKWADAAESYQDKLQRLLDTIDDVCAKGYTVSLAAASAGSSLALNAFAQRKKSVHSVVSICGKLTRMDTVSRLLFTINPAFKASMEAYKHVEPSFTASDRKKILIVRAARDSYVPADDGEVKGAPVYVMRSMGHVFSILLALTIYRRPILRFIKRGA
jgi:hypothetical protein